MNIERFNKNHTIKTNSITRTNGLKGYFRFLMNKALRKKNLKSDSDVIKCFVVFFDGSRLPFYVSVSLLIVFC